MSHVQTFQPSHIDAAIKLWQSTEHIGLNPIDDTPEALAIFLNRNDGCSFVAVIDGKLVGTSLCGHDGRRGAMYHTAVAPSHRRLGLGSLLVNASLAALAEHGIHKCHAFVFADNPHADTFWQPKGWVRRSDLLVYSEWTAANPA